MNAILDVVERFMQIMKMVRDKTKYKTEEEKEKEE